jgi:hypothetical protein
LQPVEAARRLGAAKEGSAGKVALRVGRVALRIVAGAAVRARTAADGRGDHHAVALLEVAHVVPRLFDDADTLVAEDAPRLHPWHRATDHVQVRPADGAGGQPHDGVGRVLNLGGVYFFDADVAGVLKDDGSHGSVAARGRRAKKKHGKTVRGVKQIGTTGELATPVAAGADVKRCRPPVIRH